MVFGLDIPWWRYPIAVARTIWIVSSLCYSIIAHVTWMFLLQPVNWIVPSIYRWLEGCSFSMLQIVVASWLFTCGHRGMSNRILINSIVLEFVVFHFCMDVCVSRYVVIFAH